ncbi:MAG: hypothetical protein V7K98_27530 [Nostoc sp.]
MPFIGLLEAYTVTVLVQCRRCHSCSIEMFGDRSIQMLTNYKSPME